MDEKSYGDYIVRKIIHCYFLKQEDTITATSIDKCGSIFLHNNAL